MDRKTTYSFGDKIDLLKIIKILLNERKIIIRFIILFGIVGVFIAAFSEKEYTASTIIVPQISTSKVGGSLGGLAAIAGVNLGGGGSQENISPSLYPTIVKSTPFKEKLINISLNFSELKKKVTYREYYKRHKKKNVLFLVKSYTIGLPWKIFNLFKDDSLDKKEKRNDDIYVVSKEEDGLFKQLESQLVLMSNSKDGFIKISFTMPEALASAQMTKRAQELLQKAITEFKTKKVKEEYKFIEERYNELKKDFEKKQIVLADFRDKNQSMVTSRAQSRLERFQSEYNLAYSIYSEIAKQLETQKIKLKENTPAFIVIEPVNVPIGKSNPKRGLILVIWIFLGLLLGLSFVFGKKWIHELKLNNL